MDRGQRLSRLASLYRQCEDTPVLSFIVGKGWLLVDAWSTEVEGMTLTVPSGFRFDLASVPRPLWWLIAPFDCSIEAPLAHDALYRFRGQPPAGWLTPAGRLRRRDADRWFRLLMAREDVAGWRRVCAWLAVRLAGWWPWLRSGRPAS